jgi:hypothetical protein
MCFWIIVTIAVLAGYGIYFRGNKRINERVE